MRTSIIPIGKISPLLINTLQCIDIFRILGISQRITVNINRNGNITLEITHDTSWTDQILYEVLSITEPLLSNNNRFFVWVKSKGKIIRYVFAVPFNTVGISKRLILTMYIHDNGFFINTNRKLRAAIINIIKECNISLIPGGDPNNIADDLKIRFPSHFKINIEMIEIIAQFIHKKINEL